MSPRSPVPEVRRRRVPLRAGVVPRRRESPGLARHGPHGPTSYRPTSVGRPGGSTAVDISTITAVATWALAAGTVTLLWWQVRVAQRLNSANAVLMLRERFDSPGTRRRRKTLAERLLAGRHDDITNLEVAAFFELIGSLTHEGVLDRHIVWEAFGTWINGYYYALRNPVDVIGRARAALKDPLVMGEFEWLFGLVQRMDRKMLGAGADMDGANREEATALLSREAELDTD